MVPVEHPLASVHGAMNAVFVEGAKQRAADVARPGRGRRADRDRGARRRARRRAQSRQRPPRRALQRRRPPARACRPASCASVFYISLDVLDEPGVLAEVAGIFGAHGVSIQSMEQSGFGDEARLSFLTHTRSPANVDATIDELAKLESVDSVGRLPARDRRRCPMIGWNGLLREYAQWFDLEGVDEVVTLQEGNTPLLHAERLSERLGRGRLAQVRGAQPVGIVQGPRHDDGDHQGQGPRRQDRDLRLDGQHLGRRRRLRRQGGHGLRRARPRGQDRHGQARPGDRLRRQGPPDPRQLRPGAQPGARAHPAPADHHRELDQPRPHRGPEDRRLRDRRRARQGARHPVDPGRQRRQHHGLLARLHRSTTSPGARTTLPQDVGLPGRGRGARSCSATRSPTPRRSRRRSASATPRAGCPRSRSSTSRLGDIRAVTDDEILDAYHYVARYESIFCEPASAASVAGHA